MGHVLPLVSEIQNRSGRAWHGRALGALQAGVIPPLSRWAQDDALSLIGLKGCQMQQSQPRPPVSGRCSLAPACTHTSLSVKDCECRKRS